MLTEQEIEWLDEYSHLDLEDQFDILMGQVWEDENES